MKKIRFGQKVKATAFLRRVWESRNGKGYKFWLPVEKEINGLFIGYRTLSNGSLEWWEDIGSVYKPINHFQAALVVPSETRNPVYVLLDSLTPTEATKKYRR